ncbi:unnamed protein product [Caretta caretta]
MHHQQHCQLGSEYNILLLRMRLCLHYPPDRRSGNRCTGVNLADLMKTRQIDRSSLSTLPRMRRVSVFT